MCLQPPPLAFTPAEATCSRAVIQFHLSLVEARANTIHPNILAFTLTNSTRVQVTTSITVSVFCGNAFLATWDDQWSDASNST
jgi:hypothetical protein